MCTLVYIIYNRAIFRTLTQPQASSKASPKCQMIRHIQSPGIVKTVYSSIFRIFSDIQGYRCISSHSHRIATRGCEGRGRPFGKKGPEYVHFWVKFSIKIVAFIVYQRKNPKMFLSGAFFYFWQNVYRSDLVPQKLPCPEKFQVACMYSGITLFTKHTIFNVSQCQNTPLSRLLPSNLYSDLMLCTASDTHSEFRHIQYFVYAGIFKHIQHC